MKIKWYKAFKKITIGFFVVCTLVVIISNLIVNNNAKGKVYVNTSIIPKNKVGLLLGTSKILENGTSNLYFNYRVDATEKLYKAGKIDIILISSSFEAKYNDNPEDFKKELLQRGIPEKKIFLDYNGTRTLNSIVSIKEVYQLKNVTFISQEFHNERAIYLAEHFGIKAIGFNAKDVSNRLGFKTQTREYFARVKIFVDFLFDIKPDFNHPNKIELK